MGGSKFGGSVLNFGQSHETLRNVWGRVASFFQRSYLDVHLFRKLKTARPGQPKISDREHTEIQAKLRHTYLHIIRRWRIHRPFSLSFAFFFAFQNRPTILRNFPKRKSLSSSWEPEIISKFTIGHIHQIFIVNSLLLQRNHMKVLYISRVLKKSILVEKAGSAQTNFGLKLCENNFQYKIQISNSSQFETYFF